MTFTAVGPDYYPSPAYSSIDAKAGAGDTHIITPGLGPDDGLSGYVFPGWLVGARWGDYAATAVDGNDIWVASEYIRQTCTYADYSADTPVSFFCNFTREPFHNWDTRISKLTP
jgi:hypothetical protein